MLREYIIDYSALTDEQQIDSLLDLCSKVAFTFDIDPFTRQCIVTLESDDELKFLKIPSQCQVVPRN